MLLCVFFFFFLFSRFQVFKAAPDRGLKLVVIEFSEFILVNA